VYARFGFLGAFVLAAALAACGGGGGGTTTPPTTAPTPTPTGTGPTPTPSSTSAAVTFNSTQPLPVAPGASYSGTITFASGTGSATISASTNVPTETTELNLVPGRISSSTRIATGSRAHTAQSGAPFTTTAYFTLTASSAVTISAIPTITAAGYEGAFYNTQGFWVTLPQSGTITLASGASVYFAIYTGGTLPSPNPSGCVGVQTTTRGGAAQTQLVGVQPITPGAGFMYTGTLTSTIARATPCAIPNVTSNATVSITVSTAAGTSPQVNENSMETDAYATDSVTTSTTAVVEPTSAPAPQSFAELSETTTDEVGDSTVTTYGNGALVYAIASPLPFSTPITNGPPSSVVATLADGTGTNRQYATNGTYSETDTIPGGGQNTIKVNADGSGTYNIDAGEVIFGYAAPSSGTIVVTANIGGTPQTLSIPAWFGANPTPYSDVTTDMGENPLPGTCQPAVSVPTADDFHRVISIVDPVLGYTETETIDSYVAKNFAPGNTTVGPACVVISDVQNIYYDYNYDTPYIIYASLTAAPMQTNTISEAYWYKSAPTGDTSTRPMSAGGVPGLGASIAAHASGIAFQRALERAQRIETLTRNLATRNLGGVK
jgi:hypothetical protein